MASKFDCLYQFIAQAPNAMAIFDNEMRYLGASPRWLSAYGLNGVPLGRSHYEVFPEISDDVKALHRRCLAGATESCELERLRRADGAVRWVAWVCGPGRPAMALSAESSSPAWTLRSGSTKRSRQNIARASSPPP